MESEAHKLIIYPTSASPTSTSKKKGIIIRPVEAVYRESRGSMGMMRCPRHNHSAERKCLAVSVLVPVQCSSRIYQVNCRPFATTDSASKTLRVAFPHIRQRLEPAGVCDSVC